MHRVAVTNFGHSHSAFPSITPINYNAVNLSPSFTSDVFPYNHIPIMRQHVFLLLILLFPSLLRAQEDTSKDLSPQTGYRAFVSLSVGCHIGHSMLSSHYGTTAYPSTLVTTTHGYQLNRQFFVGIGTGATLGFAAGYSRGIYSVPLFAAVRYTPMQGRYSMVLGLRAGNTFGFGKELNPDGYFITPSAGIRIALKPSLALNFTLAYVLQRQGVNTIYTYYRTTPYEHFSMHGIMAAAHLEF